MADSRLRFDFSGCRVLVTGGSNGIGLAVAREFAAANSEFVLEEPPFAFNEGQIRDRVTYWPSAFLKRLA